MKKCKHCGNSHTFVGNDTMGYHIYCSNIDCVSNRSNNPTIYRSRLTDAYSAWDTANTIQLDI